jgi:hypothetical protein
MVKEGEDLQKLKGIGGILVKRLQEAGLDSFAKIALANEEELRKINGIHPNNISSIKEQARQLAEAAHAEELTGIEALQQRLTEVKEKVQALAESTRERFHAELAGKWGKKLSSDLLRIEDTLERLCLDGKKSSKRAGKALGKVDKRVAGLAGDASLKKVHKTLKRARKAVKKAVK